MADLLPGDHNLVNYFRAIVLGHPLVCRQLETCTAEHGFPVLGIDGQHSVLLGVVWQPRHGQPTHGLLSAPDELHAMFPVISPEGIVHVKPYPSEAFQNQVAAPMHALGDQNSHRSLTINSDDPVKIDRPQLHCEFPNLLCVSADLLHVAMRVEKATRARQRVFCAF